MARRERRAKMIWSACTLLAAGVAVFYGAQFLSFYHSRGRYAVEDGKRILINVATGEITMRALDKAEPEKDSVLETEADGKPVIAAPVMYDGKARLGVVLSGFGLNRAMADRAIAFPENVAISFTPYSSDFAGWIKQAKQNKHEVLLDLPVETGNYPLEDPGPLALLNEVGKAKQLARVKTILEMCKECLGAVFPIVENVTQSSETMQPIMEALQKSGMTMIYNEKPTSNYLLQSARAIGLSTISHYVVLDDVLSKEAIDAKLEQVRLSIMEDQKTVIAVAQPYPLTLDRLAVWINEMQARGLVVSPISTLINSQ